MTEFPTVTASGTDSFIFLMLLTANNDNMVRDFNDELRHLLMDLSLAAASTGFVAYPN